MLKLIKNIEVNVSLNQEVYNKIGSEIVNRTKSNVNAGEDADKNTFTPLKSKTIKYKQAKGYGSNTLISTGKLLNSINYQANSESVSVGSDVPYAKFHQYGTKYLPVRKFIPISLEELPLGYIDNIVVKHIKGANKWLSTIQQDY